MRRARPLPPELRGTPFTVREAAAAGLTRRRTRARDLEAPFSGVRVPVGAHESDHVTAFAVRMGPEQVFSHETAARIWGIPLPTRASALIHVSVPAPGREPRLRGAVGHRLGEGIPTALTRGLPLVAAADAWCQLAVSLDLDDLIIAGDRLLGWPVALAAPAEVDAAIARFGSRRGSVRLHRARRELRAGSASPRETRLRLAVVRAGFPEPECNGPIELSAASTHGDLVFRRWRLILEYDGEQHRRDERQFGRDVNRLNELALAGWTVIRVRRQTPPAAALDLLDRALRDRGWAR